MKFASFVWLALPFLTAVNGEERGLRVSRHGTAKEQKGGTVRFRHINEDLWGGLTFLLPISLTFRAFVLFE
jgi:hypothetical protein